MPQTVLPDYSTITGCLKGDNDDTRYIKEKTFSFTRT